VRDYFVKCVATIRKPHIDLKNVLEILKKRVKKNYIGDEMNVYLYATGKEAGGIKSTRLRAQRERFNEITANEVDVMEHIGLPCATLLSKS